MRHERQAPAAGCIASSRTDVVQHNEKIATIMLRVSGLHLILGYARRWQCNNYGN